MMKIRADKPLDPIRQSVLSAISDVADRFGISVFLVERRRAKSSWSMCLIASKGVKRAI